MILRTPHPWIETEMEAWIVIDENGAPVEYWRSVDVANRVAQREPGWSWVYVYWFDGHDMAGAVRETLEDQANAKT